VHESDRNEAEVRFGTRQEVAQRREKARGDCNATIRGTRSGGNRKGWRAVTRSHTSCQAPSKILDWKFGVKNGKMYYRHILCARVWFS